MIEFRQYIEPDDIDPASLIRTEKIVTDNIHSQLASDDDPKNDDTFINISYEPGHIGGCGTQDPDGLGMWVVGRANVETYPYLKLDPEEWEVVGAQKAEVS